MVVKTTAKEPKPEAAKNSTAKKAPAVKPLLQKKSASKTCESNSRGRQNNRSCCKYLSLKVIKYTTTKKLKRTKCF